jgi:hypothetical protein
MKRNLLVIAVLLGLSAGMVYSQAPLKALLENWTSSTCPPCASNNPQLRIWIENHWSQLACVSYHVGWPSPGNDPMYLHNPVQSYDRRYYYNINSVPAGMLQGWHSFVGSPFNWNSMNSYFNYYTTTTTPVGMSLTDTRIPGDSNRVDIVVTNYTALPTGTYYLRVMAVERNIQYASPPGTNGETHFQNVFRLSVPTSQGTVINPAAGTYNFQFKYKINPVWMDSAVYTIAFIQNDVDKGITNATRQGMSSITAITPVSGEIPKSYSLMQNYPNPFNPETNINFNMPKDDYVTLKVYDMVGNEVKTLVEGNHKAGQYNMIFDGSGLASGIYFYVLKTSSFVDTKKMTLIK